MPLSDGPSDALRQGQLEPSARPRSAAGPFHAAPGAARPGDPQPEIPIVFRDDEMVVVDKPSGLLVHRSGESSDRRFLLQLLRDQIGAFVYPVHRIDRPTSGLVVMALNPRMAADLQAAMTAPDARKSYLALVRGLAPELGETQRPLTGPKGVKQAASTRWRRLSEGESCSLLEIEIATGRHHQIRRHMAHERHQLLGDTRYGKGRINHHFRESYGLSRLFLHAWRLRLRHPRSGRLLALEAPLAGDLARCLERIPGMDPWPRASR